MYFLTHVSAQNFQLENFDCAKEVAFRKSGDSIGDRGGGISTESRGSGGERELLARTLLYIFVVLSRPLNTQAKKCKPFFFFTFCCHGKYVTK